MTILEKFGNNLYPIEDEDTGEIYNSHKEFILKTCGGLNSCCLDKPISDCFSNWLSRAPKIDKLNFPYTYSYIKEPSNKNIEEMRKELVPTNFYAPSGQILYHGGIFPIKNAKINDVVKTNPMFSTSIDPYTASIHAIQDKPCNLWIISLNKAERCLPVQIDGQEEHELLIFDPLNLKITDIQSIFCEKHNVKQKMDCFFLEQL